MNPGKTIHDFRLLKGLRQQDIAKELFVEASTISCWERGQSQITAENFEKILDFLGYELVIREKPKDIQEETIDAVC